MGYYENMHNKALKQCDRVANARAECETAKIKIRAILQSVEGSWQGQSGTAFYTALSDWLTSLQTVISRLDTLEATMRQEAEAVLTYWPQLAQEVLEEQKNINPR